MKWMYFGGGKYISGGEMLFSLSKTRTCVFLGKIFYLPEWVYFREKLFALIRDSLLPDGFYAKRVLVL
jgi:hypothetical protein